MGKEKKKSKGKVGKAKARAGRATRTKASKTKGRRQHAPRRRTPKSETLLERVEDRSSDIATRTVAAAKRLAARGRKLINEATGTRTKAA